MSFFPFFCFFVSVIRSRPRSSTRWQQRSFQSDGLHLAIGRSLCLFPAQVLIKKKSEDPCKCCLVSPTPQTLNHPHCWGNWRKETGLQLDFIAGEDQGREGHPDSRPTTLLGSSSSQTFPKPKLDFMSFLNHSILPKRPVSVCVWWWWGNHNFSFLQLNASAPSLPKYPWKKRCLGPRDPVPQASQQSILFLPCLLDQRDCPFLKNDNAVYIYISVHASKHPLTFWILASPLVGSLKTFATVAVFASLPRMWVT